MKRILIILAAFALLQYWASTNRPLQSVPEHMATEGDVVLYATSWCGYCQKTREMLADQGVRYVEYDIEKSDVGLRQYVALNGNGVPVLTVGREVVHGFNESRIRDLLKR